ncbi:MAG: response regulator transcription factor [Solirubrobacterales bacterium]
MNAPRVCLVINTSPIVRIGVRSLLAPEWETEELHDGSGALELLTSVGNFDVVVVEMRAATDDGSPSGTETVRCLIGAQPALGIVALGGPLERHAVREALNAGATAYVSKRSSPGSLRSAVEAASQQEPFVDPAAGSASGATITRRQREVLQLYADGLSTGQAALRLGLSEETVRSHAKAGIGRLGARGRSHAVAMAMRGSLIE